MAAGGGDPKPTRRRDRGGDGESGLRGIVGAGPSRVGISGSLRARDVARPTDEDLARAETDVVLVRRNYRPPGSGGSSPDHS